MKKATQVPKKAATAKKVATTNKKAATKKVAAAPKKEIAKKPFDYSLPQKEVPQYNYQDSPTTMLMPTNNVTPSSVEPFEEKEEKDNTGKWVLGFIAIVIILGLLLGMS